MMTAKSAKILLAVAGVFGAGVLLWPATAIFAHICSKPARNPPKHRTGAGAPAQNRPR